MASKSKSGALKGAKKDVSFTKRSGSEKPQVARRSLQGDEDYGPRTAARIGATVGDDGAGTKMLAGLPPQTTAMSAPEAEVPAAAREIASQTLPVPGADDGPINTIWGWEHARDMKLGKQSKR